MSDTTTPADGDEGSDVIVYELDEWTERARTVLRERLETLGVPHRWEDGSTLLIATPDEAWVERLGDLLRGQLGDDLRASSETNFRSPPVFPSLELGSGQRSAYSPGVKSTVNVLLSPGARAVTPPRNSAGGGPYADYRLIRFFM